MTLLNRSATGGFRYPPYTPGRCRGPGGVGAWPAGYALK